MPPVPEGGRDGLLGSIGEILIDQVLINPVVGAPHGALGGGVSSLISSNASVTRAPGEDHSFIEGSLEVVSLDEDSEDDGMARTWILEGFEATEGIGGDKDGK